MPEQKRPKSPADVLPPELVPAYSEWSNLTCQLDATESLSEKRALQQQRAQWEEMHGRRAKAAFERAHAYLAEAEEESTEPSPIDELRALGCTVVIDDDAATGLWVELLRIDAGVRGRSFETPAEPVRKAYDAIAKYVVTRHTPDQVLEVMIPRMIFAFASTRPWSRYGKLEFLCSDLESSILTWKATRLEMSTAARRGANAARHDAKIDDVGEDEDPPIEITLKRPLVFVEFYGGRQLMLDKGGPQRAPGWIRHTETFKHGLQGDPVIIVQTQATDQSRATSRPNALPVFSNIGTPDFWRSLRSEFQALVTEQRNLGIDERHERWLRASCFYPPGYEDLSQCRIRTAINGQIISDFHDAATRGAIKLGCPAGTDPVKFWLYCLARNLQESDRKELRSEIMGNLGSGGIVHDLAGSCIGFCSRLAADAERRRIDSPAAGGEPKPSVQTESSGPDDESKGYPRLASFYGSDTAADQSASKINTDRADQAGIDNSLGPDPFADEDALPFGENPFPEGQPAHAQFNEANWRAKSDLNKLRLELITTAGDPEKEPIQPMLTFRVRAFDSLAKAAQGTVGNRETAAAYERWLEDFARFVLSDTIRIGLLKPPGAGSDQSPLFRAEILEQIRTDLTRELMKVVALHKHQLSERVLQGLQQLARANFASPLAEAPRPPDAVTTDTSITAEKDGEQAVPEDASEGHAAEVPGGGKTTAAQEPSSAVEPPDRGPRPAAGRPGRRPNPERSEAIRSAISSRGDRWREHLEEILQDLDGLGVDMGSFATRDIDLGDGKSTKPSCWADLDLAEGDQRNQIIDALRKYLLD